jgi:branched-chain amino acid transport system substrate-binding protein
MRRLGALIALAVLAGAGCQKKAEKQDAPILIGNVMPLTGEIATFGQSANNGVRLAVDEANAAGGIQGHKLEVRTYDSQGKAEQAAITATRAISEDKVRLIIGELGSAGSLAIAPIAETGKVPAISPASTSPKVTKDGDHTRKNMFRVCFIDPFQGTVMAKFARETLKSKRAAIIRDVGNDYSVGLADYFTKTFVAMGGEIAVDVSYKAGDQDFKAQLTKVKFAEPDLIYVPGYYTDVSLLARQARELGLKAPLAGGDGWDSAKLYEFAQGALDGGYFTNHYSTENPSPVVQAFKKKYEAAYQSTPDAFAALGYDAALLALDAMKRSRDLSSVAIRDAIEQTTTLQGVTGKMRLDADHNAVKSAVIMGIEKNAPKYVTSVDP